MVGRPAWYAIIALSLLMAAGCAPRQYIQFDLEPESVTNPVGELQELFAMSQGVNPLAIGEDQMMVQSAYGMRTIGYRTLREVQVSKYRGRFVVDVVDVGERRVFRVSFSTVELAKRFCHVLAAVQIRADTLHNAQGVAAQAVAAQGSTTGGTR